MQRINRRMQRRRSYARDAKKPLGTFRPITFMLFLSTDGRDECLRPDDTDVNRLSGFIFLRRNLNKTKNKETWTDNKPRFRQIPLCFCFFEHMDGMHVYRQNTQLWDSVPFKKKEHTDVNGRHRQRRTTWSCLNTKESHQTDTNKQCQASFLYIFFNTPAFYLSFFFCLEWAAGERPGWVQMHQLTKERS